MFKQFKASSLVIAIALLVNSTQVFAAPHNPENGHTGGIGIILGEPSGLVAKFWTRQDRAIDLGLAFSFNNFFLIYADYLFHFPGAFGHGSKFVSALVPYIGVGAVVLISTSNYGINSTYFNTQSSSVGLGFRVPLGIEWLPGDPPLGIFVELAPGIGIIPGTFGFLEGGIGIRYYF